MKKRIMALLILLLLFGATTVAFAYWDELQQTEEDITLPVGEGVTLEVAVGDEMTPGTKLVPSGVVLKTGDVTSVALTYTVNLDAAPLTDLNFSVTESNVFIGGAADTNNLVNIAILAPATIDENVATVTVTVTLNEPDTFEVYDVIDLTNIVFDLTFLAEIA